MTFDMGNWHWVGECPLQAAQALGRRVRYVHCKGAQRLPAKWVAPCRWPIRSAPWRAVLRALPADVPRAIEYPLIGDDLLAVTRDQIAHIRSARVTTAMTDHPPSMSRCSAKPCCCWWPTGPARSKTPPPSTSAPPAPRPTWPSACRAWA